MAISEEQDRYEAPAIKILGPAEDLTRVVKGGSGSDATSPFHIST